MNITKPINLLITEMLSERDCNNDTLNTYQRKLNLWITWMVQNGDISNPTLERVIAYKKYLTESVHRETTIYGYLAVIKILSKWLDKKGICSDFTAGIKWSKEESSSVRGVLNINQVVSVLTSMPTVTERNLRDYAIVKLMLNTGARCIEVTRIDRSDIDDLHGIYRMRLRRKGRLSKSTPIPITKEVFAPIASYMTHAMLTPNTNPLFLSVGSLPGRRLTTKTISRICIEAMKQVGITGKEFTAHSFRHTAAMIAFLSGVPLSVIQQMLGHKSQSTTEGYLRRLSEENNEAAKAIAAIGCAITKASINNKN